MAKVSYTKLTADDKELVRREFRGAVNFSTDLEHASAVAARALLSSRYQTDKAVDKAWNSKQGAEAWAATVAFLVFEKEVVLKR